MTLLVISALALSSVIIELKLVYSFPTLKRLILNSPVLGVLFSIALSMVLGWIFAVNGQVIFVAAMVSTVLTTAWYVSAKKYIDKKAEKAQSHIDSTPSPVFFWKKLTA